MSHIHGGQNQCILCCLPPAPPCSLSEKVTFSSPRSTEIMSHLPYLIFATDSILSAPFSIDVDWAFCPLARIQRTRTFFFSSRFILILIYIGWGGTTACWKYRTFHTKCFSGIENKTKIQTEPVVRYRKWVYSHVNASTYKSHSFNERVQSVPGI